MATPGAKGTAARPSACDSPAACEDCTDPSSCSTLCSATLISEEDENVSYVKHRVFGPRLFSANTHVCDLSWPRYTTLHCRYDRHPINGPPIPVAVKYLKKRQQWVVDRLVCSPSCLFSELLKQQDAYNFSTLLEINMMMLRQVYHVVGDVWRAPDEGCLQCNGGHMSIEAWRAECQRATYLPVQPPFLCYSMVFEKVNHTPVQPEAAPPNPGGQDGAVQQLVEDFERLPLDTLVTTPSENKSMHFKVRGLRIPARKKDSDNAVAAPQATNTFGQSVPLYVDFLQRKKAEPVGDAAADGKRRRRTKRKTRPAEGGMLKFIKPSSTPE